MCDGGSLQCVWFSYEVPEPPEKEEKASPHREFEERGSRNSEGTFQSRDKSPVASSSEVPSHFASREPAFVFTPEIERTRNVVCTLNEGLLLEFTNSTVYLHLSPIQLVTRLS